MFLYITKHSDGANVSRSGDMLELYCPYVASELIVEAFNRYRRQNRTLGSSNRVNQSNTVQGRAEEEVDNREKIVNFFCFISFRFCFGIWHDHSIRWG